MRTVSWILLAIVAVLIVLGSLGSLAIAYFGSPSSDIITGSTSLQDLNVTPEVARALRGRRATAAGYAFGFGVLLLFIALGPYRHGGGWAWWAVLLATAALCGTILLRLPALRTFQGAGTAGFILLIVVPSLILNRVGSRPKEPREPGPPEVS